MDIVAKLEQYKDAKNEIKILENRIAKLQSKDKKYVSDVVTSAAVFPFKKHPLVIRGYDTSFDKLSRLDQQIIKREQELEEIESFVDGINSSEIRQIIQLKYFEGMTWRKVARLMNYSKSGASDKFYRYIEKCGQNGQIM